MGLYYFILSLDARKGDRISVREGDRQLRAWLKRRGESFEEQKIKDPHMQPSGWSIDDRDIAAEIEGALRIGGPQVAVKYLQSWRPRSIALRVALILSRQLIMSGETSLLWRCVTETGIRPPWDLFLLTPLALAGEDVDMSRLERSLARLLRRGLISVDQLTDSSRDDEAVRDYFDTILTACELVVARGGNRTHVLPLIERFTDRQLRRRDRLFTSQATVIDLSLRAHAFIEQLARREATPESYLVDPPEPAQDLPSKQVEQLKRSDNEKKEELSAFIAPLLDIYNVRAKALLGLIPLEMVGVQLQAAISNYHNQEYRIRRQFDASPMRTRAAVSITRLMSLPRFDQTILFDSAIALLGPRRDSLGSTEVQIFGSLALDRSLHERILKAVTDRASTVRRLKTSAQDKVTALISFSRLLLPISFGDGNALFNQAIEVAGEIDEEAIHEIALFSPLATRAVDSMNSHERREVARDLAIVVSDAAVRLEGHDHFPWTQVAEALTTLDLSFALATAGRWEDANIVACGTFLPPLLKTALTRHELSPEQATALLPILDEADVKLIDCIVTASYRADEKLDLKSFAEELSREELMRFGHGARKQVLKKLDSLTITGGSGFWLDRLMQTTKFHEIEQQNQTSTAPNQGRTGEEIQHETEQEDSCDAIDWHAYRFVSVKEVADVTDKVISAARESSNYLRISTIFDRMRGVVALRDRRAHLDTLVDFISGKVSDHVLTDAIAKGVLEWRDSPSVDEWCKERLSSVLVNQLPGFSRFLPFDPHCLPDLLEKSGLSDQQIAAALIEGLERHVDVFNAPAVYGISGTGRKILFA